MRGASRSGFATRDPTMSYRWAVKKRTMGLSVGLLSAKTTQLGFVPGVLAETVIRPAMPSALDAVSTLSLSPRLS